MDEPRDFISGVVFGAAVGAAIGLLFAPEPGAGTRRRIQQQTSQLSHGLREQADKLMVGVKRTAKEDEVNKAADNLSSAISDVKARVELDVEGVSERLQRSSDEHQGG
jgi:gas vesicle protein